MAYHFIGIKGSGMASLANILIDLNEEVTGSDIDKFIFTQVELEEKGVFATSFSATNIKENMIVIAGNAFNDDNVEIKQAKKLESVKLYRYHEFLGELMKKYTSFCVAGTHGKTTTSGMLAHVLKQVCPTGYLIGDGSGKMPDNSSYFVVEACEYKRHFLAYHPQYAIVTNIELDHVDYYPDIDDYMAAFRSFASQVSKGLALFGDDELTRTLGVSKHHITYGLKAHNDVRAINLIEKSDYMQFDIIYQNKVFGNFKLPFVGKPMLWNSIGVIALGILENVSYEVLRDGLKSFEGVKRRFNIETNGEYVYIDDYAHHPTAIKYMLEAAKTKYPNKKIVAIFKPDRFSRIAYFLKQFKDALAFADKTYICDFPANAISEAGINITIDDLVDSCNNAVLIQEDEGGAKILAQEGECVYLFMSSKDIYKFKNIVKEFHSS